MAKISDRQRALLAAGRARYDALNILHAAGRADAMLLQNLVGKRCKKFDVEYEITRIDYSYNGFVSAHGYRIVTGGKRGRKTWDIGPITERAFEDG